MNATASGRIWSSGPQLLRFLVTGGLNTGVSYVVYLALLPRVGYHVAYGVAFAAGLMLSLVLNLKWVFRVPPSWGRALRFPLVYVPQLVLGLVANHVLIDAAGLDPRISVLLVIAMSVPLNFLIARRVMGTAPTTPPDHSTVPAARSCP